jgi:hypothetical protein
MATGADSGHANEPVRQPQSEQRHTPDSQPRGANASYGDPVLPSSLLSDPRLLGRGNSPVRQAMFLQLQQTRGNRATQRLLQRAAHRPGLPPALPAEHSAEHILPSTGQTSVQNSPIGGESEVTVQLVRKKPTGRINGFAAWRAESSKETKLFDSAFSDKPIIEIPKDTKLLVIGNMFSRMKVKVIDLSSAHYNEEAYAQTDDIIDETEAKHQEKTESKYGDKYDKYLVTAVNILNDAKLEFDHSDMRGRIFDSQYWKEVKRKKESILVLKSGTPAKAIDELFANVRKWALDCIDFIQVARWYALRHTIGEEEFNKKFGSMQFKLANHETTGLEENVLFLESGERGDPFTDEQENEPDPSIVLNTIEDENKYLSTLPVGTRVMWTNNHPKAEGTDFENENTIKVGPDRYAAHPFGVLTVDKLRKELADDQDEGEEIDPMDYYQKYIFISEIEIYKK